MEVELASRRSVLSLGLSIPASMIFSSSASAALQCTPYNAAGIQQCVVGLPSFAIRSAQQACQNWCWAACIQSIFQTRGYIVSQQEIVSRLYGNPNACRTATGSQIVNTINGLWQSNDGRRFSAQAQPLIDMSIGITNIGAAAAVANELNNNFPLINGALGHATVLTAMTYFRDVYGRGMVTNVTVRDPWPGSLHRRSLSAQEAAGTFFIARVRVS